MINKPATEAPPNLTETAQDGQGVAEKPLRDVSLIKNINDLLKACKDDFGMQPDSVYADLNIKGKSELTITPAEAYRQISAVRAGK